MWYAFWANSPTLLSATCLLLGLVIGSFLNVVIHRLPKMLEAEWQQNCQPEDDSTHTLLTPPYNLMTPGSHCPQCETAIQAWQNIPLLSYVLLAGRCHLCKTRISPRYPLVELSTGLLFAFLSWHFGWSVQLAGYLAFTAVLIALSCIDADTQLLPDSLTLPLLWGGLLFNLITATIPLQDAVLGAMAGYVVLWLVFHGFKLITGKEGMGYGDFKLLAALGAWLGWSMLPLIILLSSLVGAVVGIALIFLTKRGRGQPLPFGPYLAAAGWITLLWGKDMVAWYLHGY
ncbi:A24 family peptidase [Neisseriaceae bacterium TC5R-5]|nr:A24 family peptidase [Neisseriaceae bacterium TC5R-5]